MNDSVVIQVVLKTSFSNNMIFIHWNSSQNTSVEGLATPSPVLKNSVMKVRYSASSKGR